MANRWETMETETILGGFKITADDDCSHEIKTLAPWKKSYDKPGQCIKKQRHHFANKGPHSQSYGFSISHIWMWGLDRTEGWVLKNWCFWIVVLEKTLESPLDCKEIKPVNHKGKKSWIFIGRTDDAAETPILWPPDAKNWCICAGVQPRWIQGDLKVGTESASLEITYLITDREGLEN